MSGRERFLILAMIIMGLICVADLAYWWFTPRQINNLFLYILLSLSFWFCLIRSTGYWVVFWNLKKPGHQPARPGLTVDVFTTAAPGEPIEMTQTSLMALKNMTYPHETYLLDDSRNPILELFCKEQGIHYVTRNNKIDAKCGNVNNGLRQSNGEFILIVDPDHIVEPHYLDRVLGHFADPRVGFVQTPQVYYNKTNSFVAHGGAEQTYMFYGPIMMGMSGYQSNLVIGTNCTFRRTALESIGLYKPGLAEDLHTSMALHSKGWKSVYVPEVLAQGLTPENFSSFCHQQLKWSRGVMELLFNNFAEYARGWTWSQRLTYGLSMSYYFESIAVAINLIMPLLYLWTNQMPLNMNFWDFLHHFMPWFMIHAFLFFYSQKWLCHPSEKGIMWRGMLLYFLNFPMHLLGIFYAVIGKKIPYLPTAKIASDVFAFRLLIPQGLLAILTGIGMWLVFNGQVDVIHWSMVTFALWNLGTILLAGGLTYFSEQPVAWTLVVRRYASLFSSLGQRVRHPLERPELIK